MSERIRFAIRIIYINVVFSIWGSVHKMARTIIPTLPSMRRRTPGRAYISSIWQKNVISHFIALSLIQIIGPIHYNARFVKLLILDSEIWPEMSSPDAPRRHKGAMLVKFGCLAYPNKPYLIGQIWVYSTLNWVQCYQTPYIPPRIASGDP